MGEWRHALVHHRRPLRRDRGQDPYHLSPVPRLDRRQRLGARRPERGARQHAVHRPHLPLRGAARVRPHPRRPPLRHPVARGDAAADRRRRQHAAPAARPAPGAGRRARRARRQSRHRPRARRSRLGSLKPGELDRDRRSPPVADGPARRGQHLSRRVQPHPRLSDGRRAGAACACSRCGSAERRRPRSPPRSARPSPSASAFSACSAIRCSSSSRSSSTWPRPAKRR